MLTHCIPKKSSHFSQIQKNFRKRIFRDYFSYTYYRYVRIILNLSYFSNENEQEEQLIRYSDTIIYY